MKLLNRGGVTWVADERTGGAAPLSLAGTIAEVRLKAGEMIAAERFSANCKPAQCSLYSSRSKRLILASQSANAAANDR